MLLARSPGGWGVAAAVLVAALAGTTFPDLDQVLPLLRHRSALTHSGLAIGVMLAWDRSRSIAAGLALCIGLHLAADCFPRAMTGYATVKLPFRGSIGDASYLWLAANAALAAAAFGMLLPRVLPDPLPRWTVLVGTLLLAPWYLSGVDGGWRALGLLVLIGVAAWRIGRPSPPIRD